jgi:hypothetical protein
MIVKPMEDLTNVELRQLIQECQEGYRDAKEMFEFETAKMYKERIMEYKTALEKRRRTAI